jgi:hypothetical protein
VDSYILLIKSSPTNDISKEKKRKEKFMTPKQIEDEKKQFQVPSQFRPYLSSSIKELAVVTKEYEIWRSKTLKSNAIPQYPVLSVKNNKFNV